MAIDSFDKNFEFLSNFFIEDNGLSVEHFYQAAKTHDLEWKELIMKAKTPGKAKRLRNKAPLRKDWEQVKVQIMFDLVRKKFKNKTLAIKLIDTFPTELIEGNTWHDNFWGNCSCSDCYDKIKSNMLGFILMQIRDELLGKE